jgi:hypothetical protein
MSRSFMLPPSATMHSVAEGGSGTGAPNAGTPKDNATVTVTATGTGNLSTSATFTLAVP